MALTLKSITLRICFKHRAHFAKAKFEKLFLRMMTIIPLAYHVAHQEVALSIE